MQRAIDFELRSPRARSVSFAPLFDPFISFRERQSVRLRFRAREALSAHPIRSDDIVFFLRREGHALRRVLPLKTVKAGVFEVPFRPEGPGQYWIEVSVRGALPGSLPAVQLGVVGFAKSLGRRRALSFAPMTSRRA